MRGRVVVPAGRRRQGGRLRGGRLRGALPPRIEAAVEATSEPTLPEAPPASVREAVALAELALDGAGVAESVADARLLLAHVLQATPTWVFAHEPDRFPVSAWPAFRLAVERRRRREPLQHVLGVQEFWSLPFAVSRDALIPRPETEVLVEACLAALRDIASPCIADVGTGTGILAAALATEIPGARIVATDASPAALELAARNLRALGLEDQVELRQGHLVDGLPAGAFHGIVANLPYVTAEEWERLEPEVRDFEPTLALVGGADGLDLVRQLVAAAPVILAPGGWLGLELGDGQAAEVRRILEASGWTGVATRADFAGIERVVSARRP